MLGQNDLLRPLAEAGHPEAEALWLAWNDRSEPPDRRIKPDEESRNLKTPGTFRKRPNG